jgi:signal transduction histidine kinase
MVKVELDFAPSLPAALGDIDQVRIVFANLIRNARDAMPEGGQLTIRGRPQDNHIEIAITDTGVGILPENLARVMEPLYSTKARGLGLGLALARDILEKHGGSLNVASEPQRGSTFTVKLPAQVRTEDIPS